MISPKRPEENAKALDADSESEPSSNIYALRQLLPLTNSVALNGIFLLLLVYSLKAGSVVLIPIFLAFILELLFAPAARWLARFHIPEPITAIFVLLLLFGSIGVGIYQLAGPARDWMAKLPQTVSQVEYKLRHLKQSIKEVSKITQEVDRLTNLGDTKEKPQVEVKKSTIGESLLGPTQEFLVGVGLTSVLLFFLLASGDLFLRKLVAVLPSFSDKKLAVEVSRQIEGAISIYLLTTTVINVCFGAAVGVCMYLFGLPNPFLWGVAAGLLQFIPFLGALLGITLVTTVALVTLDNLTTIALVPLTYLGLNLLEEYVVVPLVVGQRLELNPVVIFLWVLLWGWLWGIPGALMAVPLLAIFKIICDHTERLSAIAEFLGP
jgi:predicted PurR-regulated permease PerM